MHQAVVTEWGQPPKYTEVEDPPAPGPDEVRIKLVATGVHRVVLSRASGKHYSSGSPPHVPGIDGIGQTEDGQLHYFFSFGGGTMREQINISKRSLMPLPKNVDPIQVAAMINPAMSSWIAMKLRTTNLPKDWNALILGATSASGRVAIPLARALGAKRVVGAARNKETLDKLGLDESIVIQEDVEKTDFSTVGDVHVVLDYVCGPLLEHYFTAVKPTVPVQYVHIGGLSGSDIKLPGAALRSKDITLRGSGPGAWTLQQSAENTPELLQAMVNLPEQPVRVEKLADIEKAWTSTGDGRLVIVP